MYQVAWGGGAVGASKSASAGLVVGCENRGQETVKNWIACWSSVAERQSWWRRFGVSPRCNAGT